MTVALWNGHWIPDSSTIVKQELQVAQQSVRENNRMCEDALQLVEESCLFLNPDFLADILQQLDVIHGDPWPWNKVKRRAKRRAHHLGMSVVNRYISISIIIKRNNWCCVKVLQVRLTKRIVVPRHEICESPYVSVNVMHGGYGNIINSQWIRHFNGTLLILARIH